MASGRPSQHAFLGASALLFAASAALTIAWCESMSAMGEIPMPGGWATSMAWMRMPGQTWPGAAASFLGMWAVMIVAMMLPSLVPMLWRPGRRPHRRGAPGPTDRARGRGLLRRVDRARNGRVPAGRRADGDEELIDEYYGTKVPDGFNSGNDSREEYVRLQWTVEALSDEATAP